MILKAVIVHGCMDENFVKTTCIGARFEINMRKDGKVSIENSRDEKYENQNLTRRIFLKSKSGFQNSFHIKTNRFENFLISKSHFLKKFFFKNCSIYGITVSTHHWLIQLTRNSFLFRLYTLLVYSKAICFSQSPTTVLISLSTLVQV